MALFTKRVLLKGRRALVTRTGQGIGAACAAASAAIGAYLIVTDLDPTRAATSTKRLAAVRHAVRGVALDATSADALSTAVGPIDPLICNTGSVTSAREEEMADEAWQSVIGVNLTGVFRTCRAYAPWITERPSGAIVGIGRCRVGLSTPRSPNATTMPLRPLRTSTNAMSGRGPGAARNPRERGRANLHRDDPVGKR